MGTAPLTTVGALLLGARSNVGPRSSHRTMKPLPETHDPVLVECFVDAHDGEASFRVGSALDKLERPLAQCALLGGGFDALRYLVVPWRSPRFEQCTVMCRTARSPDLARRDLRRRRQGNWAAATRFKCGLLRARLRVQITQRGHHILGVVTVCEEPNQRGARCSVRARLARRSRTAAPSRSTS